jgi:hypothetical protein
LKETLRVLKDLKRKHLIEDYAIGGGMAVVFHAEPLLTYDIDAFVILPPSSDQIVTLTPIYKYARKKGYRVRKEHILMGEMPVQIIPAYNALVEEAVREAVETRYKRVKMRVIGAEYLVAIMLQTFRPKDKFRIVMVMAEAKVDITRLNRILRKHSLWKKWVSFTKELE